MRQEKGFTLVELMTVVLIVGLLAAIAIPNFLASESRAREAAVKSNMHTFQLAAEDFRVRNDTTYAGTAADVATLLRGDFVNPFSKTTGPGQAWEDRTAYSAAPGERPGITSYCDSAFGSVYNIKGRGRVETLPLVLTNGH